MHPPRRSWQTVSDTINIPSRSVTLPNTWASTLSGQKPCTVPPWKARPWSFAPFPMAWHHWVLLPIHSGPSCGTTKFVIGLVHQSCSRFQLLVTLSQKWVTSPQSHKLYWKHWQKRKKMWELFSTALLACFKHQPTMKKCTYQGSKGYCQDCLARRSANRARVWIWTHQTLQSHCGSFWCIGKAVPCHGSVRDPIFWKVWLVLGSTATCASHCLSWRAGCLSKSTRPHKGTGRQVSPTIVGILSAAFRQTQGGLRVGRQEAKVCVNTKWISWYHNKIQWINDISYS